MENYRGITLLSVTTVGTIANRLSDWAQQYAGISILNTEFKKTCKTLDVVFILKLFTDKNVIKKEINMLCIKRLGKTF